MKRGEAMEGGQGFEIRKKSKTIDIEKINVNDGERTR